MQRRNGCVIMLISTHMTTSTGNAYSNIVCSMMCRLQYEMLHTISKLQHNMQDYIQTSTCSSYAIPSKTCHEIMDMACRLEHDMQHDMLSLPCKADLNMSSTLQIVVTSTCYEACSAYLNMPVGIQRDRRTDFTIGTTETRSQTPASCGRDYANIQ